MMQMFSVDRREALREELIELARNDSRITGGAITGSGSVGKVDAWSDIDLAFGVADSSSVAGVLEAFSEHMYRSHGVLHHLDVPNGPWIYRVFLLPDTLQVDLAFVREAHFGARAPTFRLVFGRSVELPQAPPPKPESVIAWAWLYALHVRSAIARDKVWQAEFMISGMRNQVIALACARHGLPAHEGRGVDRLPAEDLHPISDTLVRSLDRAELSRAFTATTHALIREIQIFSPELASKLSPALLALAQYGDRGN